MSGNAAVFVSTPAQAHFYKNIIKELKNRGNKVHILAREYGETLEILESEGFDYYVFSSPPPGAIKVLKLPEDILRAVRWLKNKNIDVVTGFEIYGAYVSKLISAPYVQFYDSEPDVHNLLRVQYKFMLPFTTVIITPQSFKRDLGKKHVRVNSYKELAYLHPDYFTPDSEIYNKLGLKKGEDYAIIRFNAFDAVHDKGISGFSRELKVKLVREIKKYVPVFVSSEAPIPPEIQDAKLPTKKNEIHDVLYYAKLLVTDTQTMATEAAILGTPTIRSNKFVGSKDMGNFIELQERFGLLFNIPNPEKAIEKAIEIARSESVKKEWCEKREKLLKEKTDITSFMVWFIENFPESMNEFKQNPDVPFIFR